MSEVGGQAVIEGVMMRNKSKVATAVRLPNKKIKVKKESLKQRGKFWKTPFLRGIINLYDMLSLGIRTLMWSADQQLDEHEKIKKHEVFFTLLFTFAFAILIFKGVPYFLTSLLGLKEATQPLRFNIIDGIIRAFMFFAYILIIAQFKDIKRIFQYHGAEHKAVYCNEKKLPLTLKNVKKFSTKHPRCGTSFIILVLIIAIITFVFLSIIIKNLILGFQDLSLAYQILILFPIRILFLFPIAGISYEALKLTAKYPDNFVIKILSAPGIWVQSITTKEPDNKQIEIAIKAIKEVI